MSKKKRKSGGRVIQRERRIFHGDYLDVHSFPVFKKPGKRGKKVKPSSEIQKKLNQKYRENKMLYLIHTNFNKDDFEMGLGFDDKYLPESYEDVQKAVRNYIRRIKRYRTKSNLPELKYIYVIERGKCNGRWHIHMILSGGMDRDVLEDLWGQGYAHTYRLEFDDEGLRGLAKYKVKEPETKAAVIDGKVRRWAASKNLKQPVIPKDRDGFISKATVKDIREGNISEREIERLYPGYTVTSVEPFLNTVNAGEYLTVRLRKTRTSAETKEVFNRCQDNSRRRSKSL